MIKRLIKSFAKTITTTATATTTTTTTTTTTATTTTITAATTTTTYGTTLLQLQLVPRKSHFLILAPDKKSYKNWVSGFTTDDVC